MRLRSSLAGTSPKDVGPGDIGLELGRLMRPGHGDSGEIEYSPGPAV